MLRSATVATWKSKLERVASIGPAPRAAPAPAPAPVPSASIDELRERTHAEVGVPNVLVNAAGWDRTDQFLNATPEFAQKVVAINYLGPVHVCSAFLPGIIEAGKGGRVINLASDAGRVGSSGESIYAGAKGGVIALTKSLAREMARHGINVNCVCPGPTDTPLFQLQPSFTNKRSKTLWAGKAQIEYRPVEDLLL